MPRINFIRESDIDAEAGALIASAERTGAPDPRVVRIMARSGAGRAWVKCWNSVLYEGRLPHKLKEMCRIRISVAHKCGYCSTVRSNVARADGLTEELVQDLLHEGARLSPREKAALEARLADPALYSGPQAGEVPELNRRQAELAARIEEAELRWLELHEALEAIPAD